MSYENECRERCQWCAAGHLRGEVTHRHDSSNGYESEPCTAPTKEAYIAELEKDRDHMQASWSEATRQLHEVRNAASDKIAELEARNAELKAERDRLLMFVGDLKYGNAGAILNFLQEGRISRGKAAQVLRELAEGKDIDDIPLPEIPLPDAYFGEDETPVESINGLKSQLAEAQKALAAAQAALREIEPASSFAPAFGWAEKHNKTLIAARAEAGAR